MSEVIILNISTNKAFAILTILITTSCKDSRIYNSIDIDNKNDFTFHTKAQSFDGIYEIISENSTKCLDVESSQNTKWATTNGANVQQWGCSDSNNQRWYIKNSSNDSYEIESVLSGKLLDVKDGGTSNGSNIQQWEKANNPQQRWKLTKRENGNYNIVSEKSNKCLDVENSKKTNGATLNGANVQQSTCTNNTNQSWKLRKIVPYDPNSAVQYAKNNYDQKYNKNNFFKSFDQLALDGTLEGGGNCTNFISQVMLAGLLRTSSSQSVYDNRMTYADKGQTKWYYASSTDVAEAWKGANSFRNYVDGSTIYFNYEGMHFSRITNRKKFNQYDINNIQIGDVIFASFPYYDKSKKKYIDADNSIEHSMIVTDIYKNDSSLNRVRLTYQSKNMTNVGLGDINVKYYNISGYNPVFESFRPTYFAFQKR